METASLEKEAIKAAMAGAWEKAIEINQNILKLQPKDIPALNRLGRAFWETGQIAKTRQAFQKVIKIDQYNPIAAKNLRRLTDSKKIKGIAPAKSPPLPGVFIEEPGKTKTVKLIRLAGPEVLVQLNNAEPVLLSPKTRSLAVTKEDGVYLGSLPDDLSQRLIRFIKGKNRYQAWVKTVERQHLEIFIREAHKSRRFGNLPSFSSSSVSYIPFVSPEKVYKSKPVTTPTGEEEN